MSRPTLRRRDPAAFWYSLAGLAVLVVLVLELTGMLDRLGP